MVRKVRRGCGRERSVKTGTRLGNKEAVCQGGGRCGLKKGNCLKMMVYAIKLYGRKWGKKGV